MPALADHRLGRPFIGGQVRGGVEDLAGRPAVVVEQEPDLGWSHRRPDQAR